MGGRLSRHYGPSRDEETRSLLAGEHHLYMQDLRGPLPPPEGIVAAYIVLIDGHTHNISPEEWNFLRHRNVSFENPLDWLPSRYNPVEPRGREEPYFESDEDIFD